MIGRVPELVFVGFLAAMGAIRATRVRGHAPRPPVASRATGADRALGLLYIAAAVVVPLIYIATPWLRGLDYRLPAWASAVGAGLAVVCLWLLWRAHADLGPSWTARVELHQDQALITHGIYARVRHPLYAMSLLRGAVQILLVQSWLAGPPALVIALAHYLVRVRREEQMMLDHFGDAYRAYVDRTGRLLPRLRSHRARSARHTEISP